MFAFKHQQKNKKKKRNTQTDKRLIYSADNCLVLLSRSTNVYRQTKIEFPLSLKAVLSKFSTGIH